MAVTVDGAEAAEESVDKAVLEPVADALSVLTADIPGTYENVAVVVLAAVCVGDCTEVCVAVAVVGAVADGESVGAAVAVPVADAVAVLAPDMPGTNENVAVAVLAAVCVAVCVEMAVKTALAVEDAVPDPVLWLDIPGIEENVEVAVPMADCVAVCAEVAVGAALIMEEAVPDAVVEQGAEAVAPADVLAVPLLVPVRTAAAGNAVLVAQLDAVSRLLVKAVADGAPELKGVGLDLADGVALRVSIKDVVDEAAPEFVPEADAVGAEEAVGKGVHATCCPIPGYTTRTTQFTASVKKSRPVEGSTVHAVGCVMRA